MDRTRILIPLHIDDDEEVVKKAKKKWKEIYKYLQDLGMAQDVMMTFEEFLTEMNVTEEDYILAVRSSILQTKMFLQRRVCEICINNYMKHCLHLWRANHDVQAPLDPYGMIEYICKYVTKGNTGMSVTMENAVKEARDGGLGLQKAVRHIGNAFLNSVETSQEEAACMVLQLPVTRLSREVVFIHTSPPENRTFIVKDMEDLKELAKSNPESTDIKKKNLIDYYACRPKQLESYCLAEFASTIKIENPDKVQPEDPYAENMDDDPEGEEDRQDGDEIESGDENVELMSPEEQGRKQSEILCVTRNNIIFKKRLNPRVICFVNYNRKKDYENHFRERLMLYLPW